MKAIRVVQYGLGPIGCDTARTMLRKEGLEIVGAVDVAPDKVGRDLAEVLGLKDRLGVKVSDDPEAVFRKTRAQVVAHTTRSFLRDVFGQLEQAARAGVNVVSSTEELLYPHLRNPELAAKLNRAARRGEVTIVGTGVNPGFVMDTLALVLTGVCKGVRSIAIRRCLDASMRRMPLQRKVGAGLEEGEFRKLVRQGKLGHIGLLESMHLVAEGLGWKLSRVREKVEPVLAETRQETPYFAVEPGAVCGLKHTAVGYCKGRKVLDFDLRMYLGAQDPVDAIDIDGEPPLQLRIAGGVAGDVATAASLVNAVPLVLDAGPGLKTVLDLPIPRAFKAV
jgi:4-hydroxy-tetrahydrodipicolinate reductase